MLHEIDPRAFDNAYTPFEPRLLDRVLVYREDAVLALTETGANAEGIACAEAEDGAGAVGVAYPTVAEAKKALGANWKPHFLFAIDDERFFLPSRDPLSMTVAARIMEKMSVGETAPGFAGSADAGKASSGDRRSDYLQDGMAKGETVPAPRYRWVPSKQIHSEGHGGNAYAGLMGLQLWQWYEGNRFCGRCGAELVPDAAERMLRCPHCGNMVYPRINPAVIVGIVDRERDRVLVARGVGRPVNARSLIAGFTESGETIEQTVHREVREEVGIGVKNLRYYKSQPWPLSSSLLFGFFCELDGDPAIVLQDSELAWAAWIPREELPVDDTNYSLTREMMGVMRERREALVSSPSL